MNFEFDKKTANHITKLAEVEKEVEFEVPVETSAKITKVLGLLANGRAQSVTPKSGEAEVSGRVNFKLLYLDDEGEPNSLDYFADFNEILYAQISAENVVFADIKVEETDLHGNGTMKLCAVVSITLFGVMAETMEVLIKVPDNCFTRKRMARLQCFVAQKNVDIDVSEEKEMNKTVQKVLLLTTDTVVNEAKAGLGRIMLSGDLTATVTYLADNRIQTEMFSIPFNEEVLVEQAGLNDIVITSESVKSCKVVLSGGEGNNIMRVVGDVAVKLLAFTDCECEVVEDIFMLENDINAKTQIKKFTGQCHPKYVSDKINSVALLDTAKPAVREVLGVISSSNKLASTVAKDGKVEIEGVVSGVVLYRDEDGINSLTVEVPYSKEFSVDGMTGEMQVNGYSMVEDISARAKKDHEIEIFAKIELKLCFTSENEEKFLQTVEVGEPRASKTTAFSVYIAANGETLWEASKGLFASPEQIMAQNPNLNFPMKDGDKVFFFRQLSEQF